MSISAATFIEVWNQSLRSGHGLDEVCEKTGLSRRAATARASWYRRKKGLRLRKQKLGPEGLNVAELQLIAEADGAVHGNGGEAV